jgi:hypothetical protein
MGARGPKSPAELSVIPLDISQERPEPPPELAEDEAKIWRDSVSGMRGGWFSPITHVLLKAYCLQAAIAEQCGRELRKLDVQDRRYARLAGMHLRATRSMLTTATKLRISPSSSRSPKYVMDPHGHKPRPWED